MTGSANFDMRSLFLDYEIALLFTNVAEVTQLAAWFEATLKVSSEGPPPANRIRAGVENVCRLLAPLL